jgi:HprK-related kinase B
MQTTTTALSEKLLANASLCPDRLFLQLPGCRLAIRSNSATLIAQLGRYFNHVKTDDHCADIDIVAIESAPPELGIDFIDWQREPGKSGRKDSYHDLADGRLIRKVRTGMVFLQSEAQRIAAGPCIANDNQVINFINAQYMNWLQQRDWLICHAAGLVHKGHTLGIAGFSGGGKSTLMLHLLAQPDMQYMTNDRLFIRRSGAELVATGIPKLPRVNPGTIVHNPSLHALLSEAQRQALLELPRAELWQLEQKHDVDVQSIFGADRIVQSAPLTAFLILNGSLDAATACTISPVSLADRPELLAAIMKSPGPFYQYADGSFFSDRQVLEQRPYLEALIGIPIYEATGRIDFAALVELCLQEVLQ